MNTFSWAKAIGFGVLVWLITFIVGAVVLGSGVTIGTGWGVALAIVMGVLSYLFAIGTNATSGSQAFGYGVVFAVVGLILDAIITHHYQAGIYTMWTYWLAYVLFLFAPWVEYEIQGQDQNQGSGVHSRQT